MGSHINVQIDEIADKLESILFGDDIKHTGDQSAYYQSILTDSYVYPSQLLKYFRREIYIGFLLNILLTWIMIQFFPSNLSLSWDTNPVMTIWLICQGLLNMILLIPKALLIRRLNRIKDNNDIYQANYFLWMLSRSGVYKFNIKLSKYIFSTYLLGAIFLLISWSNLAYYIPLKKAVLIVLGAFCLRVVCSFVKFFDFFQNQSGESLLDCFNGFSSIEIESLKLQKYGSVQTKENEHNDTCAICWNKYKFEEEIRIMRCNGNHFFHKKCVDKWLLRSQKCPLCNSNAFSGEEAKIKEE